MDNTELLKGIREIISEELNERFAEQDWKMDERFAVQDRKIDEKFAAQDQRMDEKFAVQDQKLDNKFLELDKKFSALENNLEDKFSSLEQNLRNEIREEFKETKLILRALEHSAEVNKAEHDAMQNDLAHINGSIENIKDKMTLLEMVTADQWREITALKIAK